MIYGRNMTKSLFKELLTKSILADEYAAVKSESFTYTDGELDDYYDAHAADLDSYDYRFCYINAEFEDKTDEDGNTVEPTEEETKAAMDAAAEKADKMIAEVRGGTAFNTAAQDYLDETSAESYSDPEYNHKTGDLGSTVTSTYREWLTDDSRQPGDLTSIEVENTGYCVVQFLGREKDTDSYQTMNYRSIQILAETTPSEDGSTALPTEDQLAAAKEQAQGLLDQWKAGDATADSFAALAKENSADETTKENGGLHEDANRDSLDAALTDWLFAQGRQVGDTTVVESTDSSGTSPATRCFTWRALARSSGSTRPPAPCARKTTTSGTKTCRPNIPQSSPKRERPSPHCNHLPAGGITLPRGFLGGIPMDHEQFLRTEMLLGSPAMERLRQSHVAVFWHRRRGKLVRRGSGAGWDRPADLGGPRPGGTHQPESPGGSPSLHPLGLEKTAAMAQRIQDINPNCILHLIPEKYEAANRDQFFRLPYDYIVDAIDLVSCKLDLIETARSRSIPILSSMGTGNKLDPSQFRVADLPKPKAAPWPASFGKS